MNEITLTLMANEVEGILFALGKLPMEQVEQLVMKIRAQTISQVQAATAAEETK